MRRQFGFFKTTVLDGVIFLLPLIIIIAVVGKAIETTLVIAKPLAEWVEVESVVGIAITDALAVVIPPLLCFFAGLLARSGLRNKLFTDADEKISAIPGYAYLRRS